ncbi:MAG: fibronectin type III domain-containing protein [Bacteroidales bacterium]|nr:fibronectin type III domain-containing protein [Bacteroidales bacterium]
MSALLAPTRVMGQNNPEKSCSAPSNFQLISVNPISVTLDWTSNGNETAWEIHYYDYSTYSEAVVEDITEHPYTVAGLQMNSGYYSFQVRAVCEDGSVSEWAGWLECTTPFCNAEDQCELHYELRSSESYGWEGQFFSVYYKLAEGEDLLVEDRYLNGSFAENDLLLCDGVTYDFVWNVGSTCALEHCSFVIYGPDGEPILKSVPLTNFNPPPITTPVCVPFVALTIIALGSGSISTPIAPHWRWMRTTLFRKL